MARAGPRIGATSRDIDAANENDKILRGLQNAIRNIRDYPARPGKQYSREI